MYYYLGKRISRVFIICSETVHQQDATPLETSLKNDWLLWTNCSRCTEVKPFDWFPVARK